MSPYTIRLLQMRRAENLVLTDARRILTINGQPVLIGGQYILIGE